MRDRKGNKNLLGFPDCSGCYKHELPLILEGGVGWARREVVVIEKKAGARQP